MEQQPHVVMLAYPLEGHVVPMRHLAGHLLSEGFTVTFVFPESYFNLTKKTDPWPLIFNNDELIKSVTEASGDGAGRLQLALLKDGIKPSVIEEGGPQKFCIQLEERLPQLLEDLITKKLMDWSSDHSIPPVCCIIADAIYSWVQDVANKLAIARAALWTAPVHAALIYHHQHLLIRNKILPFKQKTSSAQGSDVEPVVDFIPGVIPFPASDLIYLLKLDRSAMLSPYGHIVLNLFHRRAQEAIWNLCNTIPELETDASQTFAQTLEPSSKFLAIGPLHAASAAAATGCRIITNATSSRSSSGGKAPTADHETEIRKWLNWQKPASVVYTCFGSLSAYVQSPQQVEELAFGLKASGCAFLWAAKEGPEEPEILKQLREASRSYLMDLQTDDDKFPEPINGGLVVKWATQREVLAHPAVGAFVSHCGWNSLLEGLSAGVPIIAMAGHLAEQRLNQRYVADVWKVGVALNADPRTGLVGREVVRSTVVRTMLSTNDLSVIRQNTSDVMRMAGAGTPTNNLHTFIKELREISA